MSDVEYVAEFPASKVLGDRQPTQAVAGVVEVSSPGQVPKSVLCKLYMYLLYESLYSFIDKNNARNPPNNII